MNLNDLSYLATNRTDDFFQEDINQRRAEITEKVSGKRVLVIGGAGSIGSSTIRAILDFKPSSIHVVDISENNLAELIRDLRSRKQGLKVSDFRLIPLDYGSPIMRRLLMDMPPYDYILNFAAIKHVRSEKDIYSILQMFDTNIIKTARILKWLEEKNSDYHYFCVSTDKAANPVNLMGASKRIMEHVIFSNVENTNLDTHVTSARFANVAFSDGSLLYSFLRRIEKRQPIAAPENAKRYFISQSEAGQICLIAAVCAPDKNILIPRLNPDLDMRYLDDIAKNVIRYFNFEPKIYEDEKLARKNLEFDINKGYYPLLLTPLDTSGEKPYEEFVGFGETAVEIGMSNLLGIQYQSGVEGVLDDLLNYFESIISSNNKQTSIEKISENISRYIPEFNHMLSQNSLDGRM